jgi:phenylalanyl-tRNA synthetase beta chain
MKISYNWLKSIVTTELSAEEAAEQLTFSGLEVESIEPFESFKGGLQGLVVGHILECSKHPDADRLSLTKVDIGNGEPLSIVCGAPNVAAGQKVIVATVGTKLYPAEGEPFEIKKSKIRGAASEGMICAEDEIGVGKSHAGIMVLPEDTATGKPAAEYFKVEKDSVLEIGLTPNRSDAASHLGVARDLAAIINSKSHNPSLEIRLEGLNELPDESGISKVEIKLENTEGCKRYSGMIISGITVKESPDWLQNRLKSIGVRPINNIVDITNFVLHELGQPLHAFDLEKIDGKKVIVRNANKGEKFLTLDGVKRELKESDLMICNENAPMCIAGVFGGAESGVTESTHAVFLESAYFDPAHVRRSAKNHGLKTDASFRFERGTDPEMTVTALVRAANLILELAGGVISMGITDNYPEKLEPYRVAFSYTNCNALIGKEIDRDIIKKILLELGIIIESEGSDGLLLHVPRYKTDVTREADLIEEVMRIYGYNNVEVSKCISYTAFNEPRNYDVLLENKVGSLLEGFGFSEIMGLSLSAGSLYEGNENIVKVVNPLSQELNVLRANMIYGGLDTIAYNINRKNSDLKFFEIGRTYSLNNENDFKYTENKHLALFLTGNIFHENAYGLKKETDFSYLKNVVETLLYKCRIKDYKTSETENLNLENGLIFTLNNKKLVDIGKVKKSFLKAADITQNVFYADFNWSHLLKAFSKQKTEFAEISKFPSVRRDLALLIDKSIKYQQIEELAYATEKKLLKEVNLFDVYEGEKLGNKKSYAVSFTLMDKEATLTDKQIDNVMEKLISNYKQKLGAELR